MDGQQNRQTAGGMDGQTDRYERIYGRMAKRTCMKKQIGRRTDAIRYRRKHEIRIRRKCNTKERYKERQKESISRKRV